MTDALRAAVIGAGSMGANHIRVLADLEGVDLVGVCEPDIHRARQVVGHRPIPIFPSLDTLVDETPLDFATVVVPTGVHEPVARRCLEAGIHLLVEKPIAATLDEAQGLARLADERGLLLGVGHIERFNPAIAELKQRLSDGEAGAIYQLQARRVGPFPQRIRDVGVIHDLAPHDIDIGRYLLGDEVEAVYASARSEIHTAHEDSLNGILRFRGGVTMVLDINWLTPAKHRELTVLGERGMFVVDYLAQSVTFYENHEARASQGAPTGVSEGKVIRYPSSYQEPLRRQLAAFRDAVRDRTTPPVTAADGIAALAVAGALVESARLQQPVRVAAASPA